MKVFVLDAINAKGVDVLRRQAEVVLWDDPAVGQWREEADGIILRGNTPVTAADFAMAVRLRAVSKQGTGVDKIDLAAARAHGVRVMNTPALNAEAVAEMAMTLALCATRQVPMLDRLLRAGAPVAREDFDGSRGGGAHGFWGKTVGIVGMGAIGRRTAAKWRGAFAMNVMWYDPYAPVGAYADLGRRAETLADLLPEVDLLSIHAPLTAETRGLIGRAELAMMKPSAVLVSVARGGIVDEAALYEALASGALFGAALDVFEWEPPGADHPLFRLPHFIGTPHIGAGTIESREESSIAVAEQMLDVLNGGEGRNILA